MQTWDRWTKTEPTVDELVDKFERLLFYMANQAARTYGLDVDDRDDVISAMMVRLLSLPVSKRPYLGYVKMVLNNALRDGLQSVVGRGASPKATWKDYATTDYHSAAGGDVDEFDSDPLDHISPMVCPESAIVDRITLDAALDTLTPRERICVDQERLPTEIAKELGITRTYVNMIRLRALRKLRRHLTKRK
jgi:RNA polymerase sigma factor (sigma-70 family)